MTATNPRSISRSIKDQYFVVGNPIAHSLSPAIHKCFADLTKQHLTYERYCAEKNAFAKTLTTFAHFGVKGCNITVPFKQEAAQLATSQTPAVELAQAANTLVFKPSGEIYAHNTDGIGLVRDITLHANITLTSKHILLLGAGGAAAGCLAALIQEQPECITVVNRSLLRALALLERHQQLANKYKVILNGLALDDAQSFTKISNIHVIINATSTSLQNTSLPLPAAKNLLAPNALAYDMMYGSEVQQFHRWASLERCDIQLRDGLGMLVEQAAQAFHIWRGILPPVQPILHQLRQQITQR